MAGQDDYKVQLEVFEGPLDLLLYLIKRDELDIYDIPIERITKQYMQYLDVMKMLDLSIAGEFLVMAATLMMIKSRLLLPVEDRPELEAEEDDPRWDLVRQLVEYKKFKDAADHLEDLALRREDIFIREGEHIELGPEPEVALQDVSIFDLITAFQEALNCSKKEAPTEIFTDQYTVAQKVDFLTSLLREQKRAKLTDIFVGMRHRYEMVCTFLAILELIRMRQLRAMQTGPFGEIEIVAVEA